MNKFESHVKTVEVKRIDPKSLVKVMLYMMVPMAVVILLLSVLAAVGSAAFGGEGSVGAFFGVQVMVSFLGILVFEVILVVILSFVMALIYNLFSEKFGGFIMDIKSDIDYVPTTEVDRPTLEQDGSRYV